MSDYFAMSESELNALANAINTKTGESGQILGADMASKVLSIKSFAEPYVTGGDLYIDFNVPAYMMRNNTKITSVTFGANCTSIGDYAFYGCTALTSITFLGTSAVNVGKSAFWNCSSLATITSSRRVNGYTLDSTSGNQSLPTVNSLSIIYNEGTTEIGSLCNNCKATSLTVTLPSTLLTIREYSFGGCIGLTGITLPQSLTTIEQFAFYNCTNLSSVNFPDSVVSLGVNAFYGTKITTANIPNVAINTGSTQNGGQFYNCQSLVSVNIQSAIGLGQNTFRGCNHLESIVLPETLTNAGQYTFTDCSALKEIVVLKANGVVTFNNSNTFTGTPMATSGANAHIYVPANLLDTYKSTTPFSSYAALREKLTAYVSSATIGTDTYSYDYGNTFAQWVASAYNTDGFVVSGNNILNSAKTHYVAENGIAVTPTRQFIGTTYTLEAL